MGKFYGMIGYSVQTEVEPGIWDTVITERPYYGDFVRNTCKFQTSNEVNDNVSTSNEISIIADPYAYEKFHSIRYLIFNNVKWKITSAEVKYPRLILTVGGVWNE